MHTHSPISDMFGLKLDSPPPRQTSLRSSLQSPLSTSHSGDDAPLHSLRGPSTGEMRPKSDSDTVLGRSRLQGLGGGAGGRREEEGVGEGQAEEEDEVEEVKGQDDSSS